MLKRLLDRIDAFEDTPAAAVMGVGILALIIFVCLMAPEPSMMGGF